MTDRDHKEGQCKHERWHDTHHAGRLCDDCPVELCWKCSKEACEHFPAGDMVDDEIAGLE